MSKYRDLDIPSVEQLERERKRYRRGSRRRKLFRSVVAALIAIVGVVTVVSAVVMPVLQIYGSSMSPTLDDGQIVVALKGADYGRGDLVAFYYGNKLLIKRVIACPGDVISIGESGDVYVNDELLDEPYAAEKALGECDTEFPLTVGEERWFLMGDNRAVSIDSRSSVLGCVAEEQIVGKVVFRVWPYPSFGKID